MKKKLLIRTFFISFCAMLLFGGASMLLLYYHSENLVKNDLMRLSDVIKDEAQRENASLQNLATYSDTVGQAFRTTFIAPDGSVLADSLPFSVEENHRDRPEIQAAAAGKPAFHKRYSSTLNKNMLYYAVTFVRASDGAVCFLRVALEASAVSAVLYASLPVFIIIILALAAALMLLSGRYNFWLLLPFGDIKNRLHTINTGDFQKIPVQGTDGGLLPVINEINEIAGSMAALNQVRSEFFANASHELNTPLTYISGFAEMMEEGLLTDAEKIQECGRNMRVQTVRMNSLIQDMLKLSDIENKERAPAYEDIAVREMLTEITEAFSAEIKEKGLSVEILCFIDTLRSDRTLLHNILVNLMQNAVRYNVPGGKIILTAKRTRRAAEISAEDTGIGIAPADQSRIFERFYRVDKSRSKESGGTGLGLAIVKHSVLRLGGAVRLESRPGEGSKFIVTIPIG